MKKINQNQPLHQQTYEAIKDAILKGEIPAGSKIVATQLAEQFNVSRTPLREAVRQLTNEGLLVNNHMGTNVISLDQQDYEELLHCRLVLEKEIIRLVVSHITAEELLEAEKFIELSQEAFITKQNLMVLQYTTRFHEILIRACPNKRLVQLIDEVRSLLLIYRANILQYNDFNIEIVDEHRDILNAIKEKDVEKAIKKIEDHLLKDLSRGKEILNMDFFEKVSD
ncbi:GntR family transcriptional regulator [Peribacillus cavernae]|uniref:GntR family transcriptional regulator n=1 Tax=Peribacillus cavernae TaxID=1674310 RepID=UPI00163B73C9|nr:GntR family transcriptional regulator [Peribacillus cavernae]MDQ0218064.1 DNA-binding GntR family transcriptional regulator [Peribacillus cavernae]